MSPVQLSLAETREMFLYVSREMEAIRDLLTQADKAIGDGDHGIGMARGFEAVRAKLETTTYSTFDDLFRDMGTTLLSAVGGAAGAIFGTFFRGAAPLLVGQTAFDSRALALFLEGGLKAVQARGKAKPGDKTMVDAAAPAALKAHEMEDASLEITLDAVAECARRGMEKTKEMVATIGKAKTLGERSLGHADPGAISTWLILRFMNEHVAAKYSQQSSVAQK